MKPNKKKGKWFKADTRASLRRLNDLGVSGQQPAIMAYCQMTKSEKDQITEAILKQKVANNKKAEAMYTEHRERHKTQKNPLKQRSLRGTRRHDPP